LGERVSNSHSSSTKLEPEHKLEAATEEASGEKNPTEFLQKSFDMPHGRQVLLPLEGLQ